MPQGKGQSKVIDNEMLNINLNHSSWLNSDVMEGWVTRYEDAKARSQREKALFCTQCSGTRVPYPHHLRALPKNMDVNWLHHEMDRVERDEDMHITSLEWEMVEDVYQRLVCPIICMS